VIAATARLRGTVVALAGAAGTFSGVVVNPAAAAPATFSGTVSRARIEALDARSTSIGVRVKLAGEWIPREDLAAPLTWSEGIDTHRRSVRLTLAGERWGVLATLATWTLTPIEVWTQQGQPPAPLEELEFRGWVRSGTRQTGAHEPLVELTCDDVAPWDRFDLCHEVPPLSGLTRGQIAAALAADAGLNLVDTPGGAVYDRPLFTDSRPLFEVLHPLGEPEGWSWRLRPDPAGAVPTLEAYVARLKQPPQPPDWIWHESQADPGGVELEAPTDPPSRYVVRGLGPVYVDEQGIEREHIRTQVIAPYAPVIAVQFQQGGGTIDDLSPSFPPESERIVQVIEVETQRRGGQDVLQLTEEWAWYNPAAPKYRTGPGDAGGPVGAGYYFAAAYIDQDGAYVAWEAERFVQTGARALSWVHGDGQRVDQQRAKESRWHRRRRSVRTVASAVPNIAGSWVGDDDVSYQGFDLQGPGVTAIEIFGLDAEHITLFGYDAASGASTSETLQTISWREGRASIDGGSHEINYDGRGQQQREATRQVTGRRHLVNILTEDARIVGTVEIESGWDSGSAPDGDHDWGDFTSFRDEETFHPLRATHTMYHRRADGTIEEVSIPTDGVPNTRIIQGRLPLPRFLESPWTVLRSQPLEHVLDDPDLAELFGFSREVLNLEHIVSIDEAREVARRRRRRATAVKVTWRRAETRARPGDTVFLVAPSHGLAVRALLTARDISRDPHRGAASATYHLEVYPL
jgi:hypothetical protein